MRDTYMFAKTGQMPQKTNPNTGKLDLGHLRREAEENGFNPLTVLRATGGQGSRYSEPAKLASSQFWNVFNDETKQSTAPAPQLRLKKERGRDDIPSTVLVFDPTGNHPDFRVSNPELLENSASEVLSSASLVAAQYVAQHGGDYETVIAAITKINQKRQENEKNPIRLNNKKLSKDVIKQITNFLGNSLDAKLQSLEKSIGFDRNEKITVTPILSSAQFDNKLGIKKPIKGLTTRARERQDRINQQMGW